MKLIDDTKANKKIWVSETSIRLLQQAQANAEKVMKTKVSYDKIIALTLDRPSVILLDNGDSNKKKRFRTLFDVPLADIRNIKKEI